MSDERRERIEVLLDVMGDFHNLSNELTAEPPCYSEIIACVDTMIATLNGVKKYLLKIEKELANVTKDTYTDADTDPS